MIGLRAWPRVGPPTSTNESCVEFACFRGADPAKYLLCCGWKFCLALSKVRELLELRSASEAKEKSKYGQCQERLMINLMVERKELDAGEPDDGEANPIEIDSDNAGIQARKLNCNEIHSC